MAQTNPRTHPINNSSKQNSTPRVTTPSKPAHSPQHLNDPESQEEASLLKLGNSAAISKEEETKIAKAELSFAGTLKGPILPQISIMYAFFILIVGSAQVLNWAPYIRVNNFVPYVVVCYTLVEITRLFWFRPTIRVLFPFYTSVIPYIYLCIFSREAHVVVTILFFCATLSIFLQSGIPNLRSHVLVYIVLFLISYAASIYFITWFYTDTTGLSSGKGHTLDPPMSWTQEVTIMISLVLVGISFLMLERFVKLYAHSLLERSHQIIALEREKDELEKEIKKYKGDEEIDVDLDAPIQKVIGVLQEISNSADVSVRDQLQFVIKTLASNKLYAPNLNFEENKGVDGDVSSWLHQMITSGEQKNSNKFTSGALTITGKDTGSPHDRKNMAMYLPVLDKGIEMQVQALLERVEEYDFNLFELSELTHGRPLFFTGYTLLTRNDILKKFSVDEGRLRRFLNVMESGYDNRNPYHNSIHASDVLQTLAYFIFKGGLAQYLTELDILAALIAAIIHDYEHPGLNNAYHINTQSELAVRYNDRSILENYHCAQAYELLARDENNIFSGLTDAQKKEVRESVISMVLATDMAQHFDILGKFKSKMAGNGFDPKDRKDRLLLLQLAVKCADISNPTKAPYLCNRWASCVMEEFYRQGDEERRQGMPISSFMDRTKPAEAKCQVGFIDFIVGPLYEVWVNFLPDMGLCLQNLEANRTSWKKKNLPTETLVYDQPPSTKTSGQGDNMAPPNQVSN
eukprot:TRINITY_DN214_c0_g1_i1.p1 TRINITY_DN214_c0_g1~~TRINITY_DN214_c0_g1_i1.p1  ORF type:complete len:745 (+),score=137.62 TRINITY_DN214_c0_g1_i1:217-2451(+)